MNYYEHHLGDYAKDAGHLSLIEEGAYRRLLDAYYTRERPLPAELRECCKLARATSKPERDAVVYVLAEFFTLDPDGGHRQGRADAEIARFQDKQCKAKASADARWSHSERNANAYANAPPKDANAYANAPPKDANAYANAPPKDANAYANAPPKDANASAETMRTHCEGNAPRARPQSPVTSNQTPSSETSHLAVAPARPSAEPPPLQLVGDSPKGPPDCPHLAVLALWAEVLPALPQHLPEQWRGTRADHLRARWREAAVLKRWTDKQHGLDYFRRLFAYVGQSAWLTGKVRPSDPSKRPFVIELEWLVNPTNWAKVHEGKYNEESA